MIVALLLVVLFLASPSDGGGGGSGGPPVTGRGDGAGGVLLEGSPTSYAQFRQWRGGANSTIEFEFSSARPDALLLYSDANAASGSGQYVQVSLVGDAVRLRFNWGGGRRGVLTAGKGLAEPDDPADGGGRKWHHVLVVNAGGETSLVVDRAYRAGTNFGKEAAGPGGDYFSGGNTSYVFVGGLPSWYGEKGGLLALPLVLLEPRLQGAVRRLRYRAATGAGPRRKDKSKRRKKGGRKGGGKEGAATSEAVQQMMAYKVRSQTALLLLYPSHCTPTNFPLPFHKHSF